MNKIIRPMLVAFASIVAVGLNSNALGGELKDTAVTQVVASVLHVDQEARQILVIELEGIAEAEPYETTTWLYRTYSVNKKVAAFDYVRAGDKVILDIDTSLAIKLREPKDNEIEHSFNSHTITSKKGVLEHVITAVCEVVAIDKKSDKVTFRGPRGRLFSVKVADDVMFGRNQIGDTLVVTYNQGAIVGLSRAN